MVKVMGYLKVEVKLFENGKFIKKSYLVKEEDLDYYTTVLELLLKIREELDPSLVLRYSCRMAMCGSCGMIINGKPRLACLTKVKDLKRPIKIEPLKNVNIVRGLVPDLTIFFSKYRSVQPFLVAKDRNEQENPTAPFKQNDDEVKRYLQFNYCIQCGLCYSACPIVATNPKFLGPAAIAVAYSYSADSRDYNRKRIDLLNSSTGIWSCRIASSCSVVCPKGVDPSLAIQLTKYSVIRKGKN